MIYYELLIIILIKEDDNNTIQSNLDLNPDSLGPDEIQ